MLLYMSTLCSTSFQCGCLRYFFTGLRSINNLSIQLEKKKKDLLSLNLWWFSGGLYFLHHGSQQGTHSTSQHSKLQMLHEDTKCQKIVFPMCIYISYILVYHFRSGKLNPSCKVCFEPTTILTISRQCLLLVFSCGLLELSSAWQHQQLVSNSLYITVHHNIQLEFLSNFSLFLTVLEFSVLQMSFCTLFVAMEMSLKLRGVETI